MVKLLIPVEPADTARSADLKPNSLVLSRLMDEARQARLRAARPPTPELPAVSWDRVRYSYD